MGTEVDAAEPDRRRQRDARRQQRRAAAPARPQPQGRRDREPGVERPSARRGRSDRKTRPPRRASPRAEAGRSAPSSAARAASSSTVPAIRIASSGLWPWRAKTTAAISATGTITSEEPSARDHLGDVGEPVAADVVDEVDRGLVRPGRAGVVADDDRVGDEDEAADGERRQRRRQLEPEVARRHPVPEEAGLRREAAPEADNGRSQRRCSISATAFSRFSGTRRYLTATIRKTIAPTRKAK